MVRFTPGEIKRVKTVCTVYKRSRQNTHTHVKYLLPTAVVSLSLSLACTWVELVLPGQPRGHFVISIASTAPRLYTAYARDIYELDSGRL